MPKLPMLFHVLRCLWRKRPCERRHVKEGIGTLISDHSLSLCCAYIKASLFGVVQPWVKQPLSTWSLWWAGGLEDRVPGGWESKHRKDVSPPGSRALASSEDFEGIKPQRVSEPSSGISQARKGGIWGWTTWLNEMNRSGNEMFIE